MWVKKQSLFVLLFLVLAVSVSAEFVNYGTNATVQCSLVDTGICINIIDGDRDSSVRLDNDGNESFLLDFGSVFDTYVIRLVTTADANTQPRNMYILGSDNSSFDVTNVLFVNESSPNLPNENVVCGVDRNCYHFLVDSNYTNYRLNWTTTFKTLGFELEFLVGDDDLPNIEVLSDSMIKADNTSVISSALYNLSISMNFTDDVYVNYAHTNITCDLNGTIYTYVLNESSHTAFHFSETADISNYHPQKCVMYSNIYDWIGNETQLYLEFHIGGYVNVTGNNRYDNTSVSNFTVVVTPDVGSSKTYLFTGLHGLVENITNASFIISSPNYFNQSYSVWMQNHSQTLQYNTFESVVMLYVQDGRLGTHLPFYNLTLTNLNISKTDYVFNKSNNSNFLPLYLNASNYSYLVSLGNYDNVTEYHLLTHGQNLTLAISMVYFFQVFLLDEVNIVPFDVNNISSAKIWVNDNSTFIDLQSLNVSNFTFSSLNNTKIRVELVYADGGVVNRYIDMSLFDSSLIEVCANREGVTHNQQLIQSNQQKVAMLQNNNARCFVVADYTRFAYQNAYSLNAYTIDASYNLFTFNDSDEVYKLVGIDGGTASYINLDTIESGQQTFDLNIVTDSLSIQQNGTYQFLVSFRNLRNDSNSTTILIYRLDTSQLVYNDSSWSNPNSIAFYYNFVSLANLTNETTFKIEAHKHLTSGGVEITRRYFNLAGNTGTLPTGFAVTISILLMFFGLSLVSTRQTFGWFGILICIIALIFTALAIPTWELRFLQVMETMIMIYFGVYLSRANYRVIS